jgi:PEP-CTERM motif
MSKRVSTMRSMLLPPVFAAAIALISGPAGAAPMVAENWSFLGMPSGNMGSGSLTYDSSTGLVSSFTGTFIERPLTFWDASTPPVQANDPSPGLLTYHGVPNTGGADFIFDDLLPIDINGILVSTGSGASERFYDISLDSPGATQVDFFSINLNGSYVFDDGTFTTTPASVPEPATWVILLAAFAALAAVLRGSRRKLASPSPALK